MRIVSERNKMPHTTSSIQTVYTVGFGVAPNQRLRARGLYRRSGISPCPEDILFF